MRVATLSEMLEEIVRLGEATGMEDHAHELRGELEGRLATIRAAVAGDGLAAGDRPAAARPAAGRRLLDPGDDLDRRRRGRRRRPRPQPARRSAGASSRASAPTSSWSCPRSRSRTRRRRRWSTGSRSPALGATRLYAVDGDDLRRPRAAPGRRRRAARPRPPPRPGRPARQRRLRRRCGRRARGRRAAPRLGLRRPRARRALRRRATATIAAISSGSRLRPKHAFLAGDDRPGRRSTPPIRPPMWPPTLMFEARRSSRPG